MVRYDGLLNAFHSLNFSRLTHPTILLRLQREIPRYHYFGSCFFLFYKLMSQITKELIYTDELETARYKPNIMKIKAVPVVQFNRSAKISHASIPVKTGSDR